VPRLEKELDRLIAGDYTVRLKTRSKDNLKNFVEKVNLAIEKAISLRGPTGN
jgi:hypothetical protein